MEILSSTGCEPEIVILENPGYYDLIYESFNYFRCQLSLEKSWMSWETIENDLRLVEEGVKGIDFVVLLGAILLVIHTRKWLTNYVFIPICCWRKLPETDAQSAPESGWKFVFHLSTSVAMTAYMIQDGWKLLNEPISSLNDWSLSNRVDSGIYWIYAIELGYYFSALYTTLAVDRYRKDTPAMMVHHVITLWLILGSYANRTHKLGIVTLYLHDTCDVLLECFKLAKYFKVQNGKTYHFLEGFAVVIFLAFLTSWMINRLYLFPLRVIYFYTVYGEHFRPPFLFSIISMLWLVQLLNVFWFTIIVRILYRAVLNGEVEDEREFEEPKVASNSLKTSFQSDSGSQRRLSADSGVNFDHFRSPSGSSFSRTTTEPEVADESISEMAFQKTVLRHRK